MKYLLLSLLSLVAIAWVRPAQKDSFLFIIEGKPVILDHDAYPVYPGNYPYNIQKVFIWPNLPKGWGQRGPIYWHGYKLVKVEVMYNGRSSWNRLETDFERVLGGPHLKERGIRCTQAEWIKGWLHD